MLGSTHIKTIQNITEEAKWKQKQDLYQNRTNNKKNIGTWAWPEVRGERSFDFDENKFWTTKSLSLSRRMTQWAARGTNSTSSH